MTDIDIVERLQTARDDDHERGCNMRYASCSCGFDDKCARAAGEGAATIRTLRALLKDYLDAEEIDDPAERLIELAVCRKLVRDQVGDKW